MTISVAAAYGQTVQTKFERRTAWVLESAGVRMMILQGGGHVASMTLAGPGAVNPLWVQSRPTLEPESYRAERDAKTYGGDAGARLMSGLMGHNLCFPYWGNPSPAEERAGMTFHGETGIAKWSRVDGGPDWIRIMADLPESRTSFTRTVRLKGQVAAFEETAENRAAWDRPVGWCEHVTMGPPFLEKGVTRFEASLTRGRVLGEHSGKEFAWPRNGDLDLRTVKNVPRSGFVDNLLVDPAREYGYFCAWHPGKRLLFGYVFRRLEFPWLNLWEANNPEMLTRGMEFSNTPVHGTVKALVSEPKLWGVPTFEWLDGKGRLTKRYWAFSAPVPEGFRGVADVRMKDGAIEIVEAETGKVISLPR